MQNNSQKSMAHRKVSTPLHTDNLTPINRELLRRLTYGVPSPRRMLTPGILSRKHYCIRSCLKMLGLTTSERDAAFYLLRLYAYHGSVYPKAPNFTQDFYASKRSFWRAIAKLEGLGVVDRINRFLDHLQISNCYRMDKLVLCIVRYLAEHGKPPTDKFSQDIIKQMAGNFWLTLKTIQVRLRDTIPISIMT